MAGHAEGLADQRRCPECDWNFTGEDGVKAEDGTVLCSDDCRADYEEGNPNLWVDPEDCLIDGVGFADPGGHSALRAETPGNPRNLPCPNCGEPNMLTPLDRARHYCCDTCSDAAERGLDY